MILGIGEARSYGEMLAALQPRPITSEDEAIRTQGIIDALIDEGPASDDETEILRLLGGLIRLWEEDRYTLPDISGPEAVRALLRERGMKQADLVPGVFPTRSVGSEVLSGKRSMSLDTVRKLARFFDVPAAVFIEDPRVPQPDESAQDQERYGEPTADLKKPRASIRESGARLTTGADVPFTSSRGSDKEEAIDRLRSLALSLLEVAGELERP
jgi:HTH-type transcriptional regulator/antitoxin HigA